MNRTRLSFDSQLLLGVLCGAILVGIVLYLAHYSVQQVRVTSGQLHHTQELRLKLRAIGETILDMETGQRGFLLTSRPEYIEPYVTAQVQLSDDLHTLQALLAQNGNPRQVENFRTLERLLGMRREQMARALELHRAEGAEAALGFMITNQGHFTMDAIRKLLDRMSEGELQQLELRAANESASLRLNFAFSALLSVMAVGLLVVSYLLVRREIAARAEAARQLDAANANLEVRVREATAELSAANAALQEEVVQRREAEAELSRERQLLEARVSERTAELVAAGESKSRFLSAASHDLRQPLHSLTLLNATLRGQQLAPSAREIAEAQQQSIESMSRLVHALLNISMLESGVIQPQIQDFPVHDVIAPLHGEFAQFARAKGLALDLDIADPVVSSDPTLLKEILQNLLENAIRYTQHGTVRVHVESNAAMVRIAVSDTGPGIPASGLELIFQEFHQLRPAGRSREGFGLGLAIVKHLVKLLGIELKVQSIVGVGTTFTLEVAAGSKVRQTGGAQHHVPCESRRTGCILLVDDEAPVLQATALFLGLEGHAVITAGSPDEALAKLQSAERTPDVIVSDYQLGTEVTGADLIEQVRAVLRSCIPAVVLSGDVLRVARRCQTLMDCRVFHKPVDAEELAQHLGAILETSGAAAGRELQQLQTANTA